MCQREVSSCSLESKPGPGGTDASRTTHVLWYKGKGFLAPKSLLVTKRYQRGRGLCRSVAPQCLVGGDTTWACPCPTPSLGHPTGVHPCLQHPSPRLSSQLRQRLPGAGADHPPVGRTGGSPVVPQHQWSWDAHELAPVRGETGVPWLGCWQTHGQGSGDSCSVLSGVEPRPDTHDNTEGEAEEGRGGDPDQRQQHGRDGGFGRRAREVRASREGGAEKKPQYLPVQLLPVLWGHTRGHGMSSVTATTLLCPLCVLLACG